MVFVSSNCGSRGVDMAIELLPEELIYFIVVLTPPGHTVRAATAVGSMAHREARQVHNAMENQCTHLYSGKW